MYRLLVAAFAGVLLGLPWLNEQLFPAVWIGMKGAKANRVFTRVDFHLPRGLSVPPWRLSYEESLTMDQNKGGEGPFDGIARRKPRSKDRRSRFWRGIFFAN